MGLTLNGRKVLDRTLLRGQEFILDADEDSSLTADTDDQLDLRLGGNDVFVFKTSELDITGVNIVNCGDIALDSISDDGGTGINIAMMDASATALTIKEAANAYLTFDTSNGTENIILGKKLTGGAVEIEGSAFDINGGTVDGITSLTVGTDGSGADVYFYSATGGDHLFWDSSEELLTVTGTNGQTALSVADGNMIVADTFYLFDAGGESLSGDGTDLTIASGALINLTATSDVVIPVNIGLHLGDGAEKLESNNTDLTINSGVDINLTATTDINVPANVGMTFGNDGEKIEGDGADLTIASSGVLNLAITGNVGIREAAPVTLTEWSSTAPYLTIHNTTEENIDYGREGKIIFRGEQDGTEESVLGELEFAHDGTADDEKGIFTIRINDGNDGTSPTDRLTIDSLGNVGIGTTGPGDFSAFGNRLVVGDGSDDEGLTIYSGNAAGKMGSIVFADGTGSAAERRAGQIRYKHDIDAMIFSTAAGVKVKIDSSGNVGIATTAPGQILDCNDGSGNMIADGYDNHPSFLADKVDPRPMSDVLTRFKQVIPYEYKRIPYVSAEELAGAGIKEFGQERWEAAFPDGYRGGKLKHCPDEEIKAFLDNLAGELRAERQEWPKYQRLHYSLALDDLADTFPDILSRNKDGDVTGYSLNNYVGLLHACITELVEKVEQLETKKGQ